MKVSDDIRDFLLRKGKLPRWDSLYINPEHCWAHALVEVQPAGWMPEEHEEFLKLCKVTTKKNEPLAELLRQSKTALAAAFGVTYTCGSSNPPRYHVKDQKKVIAWLVAIDPKLYVTTENDPMSKKSEDADGITEKTTRRRANGTTAKKSSKRRANKKEAAPDTGPKRGRPTTFEHEAEFLRMLGRKSGVKVEEATEKFGCDAGMIRKQIDRLRRGGHAIVRGEERGHFRIEG